ncbi:hypothetical protein GCM10007079_15850 [Nocardiopsis terrae]|uniref:DUF4352 domain-containing protein n=1 Tax=Nocardiopsis terrae TaxID=372655 RepID=A0ABR9HB09_9ACTN|nr:hypothetical protein [Nocardiopsis terrae]MBE1456212.1 hypothetical protein [Nocardiopsis terrae]GHC78154.1 hypothetical protein GCM10007079_15850 [Nocardiopsis terrae]
MGQTPHQPQGPSPAESGPPYGPWSGGGPPAPGAGAPKRRRGLVVGAVAGSLTLVAAVGGALLWVDSGRDFVSLPDDCSEVVGEEILQEAFDGATPEVTGGFDTDDTDDLGLHGELRCSASHEGAKFAVTVLLSDREDEKRLDLRFQQYGTPDAELFDGVPAGELAEHDFGEGTTVDVLWDEPPLGERSVVSVIVQDPGEGGYFVMESGQGAVWAGNAVVLVGLDNSMAPEPSGLDARSLHDRVGSLTEAVVEQVPRVAEK